LRGPICFCSLGLTAVLSVALLRKLNKLCIRMHCRAAFGRLDVKNPVRSGVAVGSIKQ